MDEDYQIQRSPLWHKHRAYKIGSSEASQIMGVSPWGSALDLYNLKVKHQDLIENNLNWKELIVQDSKKPNYAMRRGIELEPLALSKFEAETGYLMTPRVLTHPKYEFLSASLDGLELEGSCAVEIKAPGKIDHDLAKKGIVPEKYYPQLQHIMEVCQLQEIYYMSYISDLDFTIFTVKKDHDYTNRLITAELEFWNRLQSRTPPDKTDRDIKEISSPEFDALSNEWRDLQNTKQNIELREEEIRKKLIEMVDYESAQGHGIKITRCMQKGRVDYKSLVKDKLGEDFDEEPYRKPSTETWRITLQGDEE